MKRYPLHLQQYSFSIETRYGIKATLTKQNKKKEKEEKTVEID